MKEILLRQTRGPHSLLNDSHKKKHSLEIWAVKLWFLLIYENMFKSIATACSAYTAKQKNKASYNADYIVPYLTDFKTQIGKGNIYNCKKYFTD